MSLLTGSLNHSLTDSDNSLSSSGLSDSTDSTHSRREVFGHFNRQLKILITEIRKKKTNPKLNKISARELFRVLQDITENLTQTIPTLRSREVDQRFSNITCPRHSRLPYRSAKQREYLHANYVTANNGTTFILTQYPLVKSSYITSLFWEACFSEVGIIVDLTNKGDQERDPSVIKYYPNKSNNYSVKALGYTITSQKIEKIENILTVYQLTLQYHEAEKKIYRIHYRAWEDHSNTAVLKLSSLLKVFNKYLKKGFGKPLVHCRAGVGRSGTFFVAWDLDQRDLNRADYIEIIARTILEARRDRGPVAVQRPVQLETIINLVENHLRPQREYFSPIARTENFLRNSM